MLYLTLLKDFDSTYTTRYIKFLEYCKTKNVDYKGIMERHHILPESIFPEYKSFRKNPWNLIKLTPRQHFIAHWMLAKIYGGKLWFAFNLMKRVGHTSCLYEAGRKYISEEAKKLNTGRPKSDKDCANISARTKNTVVVKDKDNNLSRVSVEDPRYISGELVFYRTGSKHKEETIQRMSDNSGIKGKKPFITEDGEKIIYLFPEEGDKMGLKMGILDHTKDKIADRFIRSIWVTLKENGTHKRIREEEFSEEIYLRGRIGYKGWEHVNVARRKH